MKAIAWTLAALLALGGASAARAQQQGMMGPGMMGPGWMNPGMMGPMMQGQGGGGMMGPGTMGQGWMGPGMQGGVMGPMGQGWMMPGPMMPGQGMMGPGMPGSGMMMGPGMMGGMMMGPSSAQLDPYLAAAKGQLGIGADQEQAWSAYVEAVKKAADAMTSNRQAMMGACMQGQMSMPEMHAQMLSLMEARLAALKDVNAAAKALYEELNPQQRALADRVLPQGMGMMM